jgi:hypothetical protein
MTRTTHPAALFLGCLLGLSPAVAMAQDASAPAAEGADADAADAADEGEATSEDTEATDASGAEATSEEGGEPPAEEAPAEEAPAEEAPDEEAPAEEAPAAEKPASGDDDATPDEETQASDDAAKKAPPFDVHFGLNLRTDLGAHPIRLDMGVRWEMVDVVLVVDPMVFTDGLMSTDLLLMWRTPIGVAPLAGWRLNTLNVIDGPQMQQNLVVGAAGDLPRFFGGWLRGQAGLELAATIVRHGGGLPAEMIGFSSGRSYIDLLNFALFLRGEFAVPLGGSW